MREEQQKKRRGILSPELRAELERRRSLAETALGAEKAGNGAQANARKRAKIKLPAGKKGVPGTQHEPSANPVPAKRPPFEERYRRVTTYLERDLHARIQELRGSGRVGSVTALYNAALRQYISRYYGDGGD